MTRRIHAPDGQLIREETIDLDAGKTVVVDHENGGAVTEVAIDPDQLADRRAADREERQLTRLDAKLAEIGDGLTNLRDMDALTNGDYPAGPERDMAKQVKELRKLSIDQAVAIRVLIRLVRNIAAEDD